MKEHKLPLDIIDSGRAGYDDVNGVVVGFVMVSWQLFYDGRPQCSKTAAVDDAAAIAAASSLCKSLQNDFCGFPTYLYPDKSKWECRIY